jgi:hypothetical protein
MKHIPILLVFFIFLLGNSGVFSQGWEKVYMDTSNHNSSGYVPGNTQKTSDGGNISIVSENWVSKIFLVKTNSSGDLMWSKGYIGTNLRATSVIETNDGYLIGGDSAYKSSLVIKVDFNGSIIWTKTYNCANSVVMLQKNANGFYLTGQNSLNNGVCIAKVNGNGNVIWAKTDGLGQFYPRGMVLVENGNVVVFGTKQSYTYGYGSECYIVKFDSLGTTVWGRSYSYKNDFIANCIKVTNTGDYIIGGSVLLKINQNGEVLWVKNWYDPIRDIYQTADNGYVLISDGIYDDKGINLYKITKDGIPLWKRKFGGIIDYATTIVSVDKGILISGFHGEYGNKVNGLYLIKTDSLGNSGCNSKLGVLPIYHPSSSLCVVKSINGLSPGNTVSNIITLSSTSMVVKVVNSCCFAKAEIKSDNYPNCSGDSIRLSGSGAPILKWFNGATTNTITTKDTVVVLTVTNSCKSFTDTLIIHPWFTPTFTYSLSKDTICRGDSVLLNIKGNAPFYNLNGNNIKQINETNYVLKPIASSNYTINGNTSRYASGCNTLQTFHINVNPDKPTITKSKDRVVSSAASGNQWYLDGTILTGEIYQSTLGIHGGKYSVKVSRSGCSNISDPFLYLSDALVYTRQAWQKNLVSHAAGIGTCILQANDGGLLIGSSYNSYANEDIAIIRTDRNGNVLWSKLYGGSEEDKIKSIIKVNGGYVGVGSTTSFGSGAADVYVFKIDEQGALLWSQTYGDYNDQVGNSIEQTKDGGFIITGYSTKRQSYYEVNRYGDIVNNNDVYLLKIDKNGNLQWSNVYDSSNNEVGVEVHETVNGDFIIGGTSTDVLEYGKVAILKTDQNGKFIWSRVIANSWWANTTSMKMTPDNNYLITANASGSTYLLKIDTTGVVIWSKTAKTGGGGGPLIIANDNTALFSSLMKCTLTKVNMNGDLIWTNEYDNYLQHSMNALIQLNDGSFASTGYIDTSGHYGPGQISIVNTDLNGQTNCSSTGLTVIVNENYTYFQYATSVSSLGIGMQAPTNTNSTYFQAGNLCRSSSVISSVRELPKDIPLLTYPNPTAGIINLEHLSFKETSIVSVIDLTGRTVYEQSIHAKSIFQMDLSSLPKGLYVLQVSTNAGREVRKIVLY